MKPTWSKADIHRFHDKDDTKLFCERLQQVMTKWHKLLEYLLIPIEKDKTNKDSRTGKKEISDKKNDDRITKALTALQLSVEKVENVCKDIRSK